MKTFEEYIYDSKKLNHPYKVAFFIGEMRYYGINLLHKYTFEQAMIVLYYIHKVRKAANNIYKYMERYILNKIKKGDFENKFPVAIEFGKNTRRIKFNIEYKEEKVINHKILRELLPDDYDYDRVVKIKKKKYIQVIDDKTIKRLNDYVR